MAHEAQELLLALEAPVDGEHHLGGVGLLLRSLVVHRLLINDMPHELGF
jgi:hypothetical protein